MSRRAKQKRRSRTTRAVVATLGGLILLAGVVLRIDYLKEQEEEVLRRFAITSAPHWPTRRIQEFPRPPWAASASYVLPDYFFESRRTVGEVVDKINLALENNGFDKQSFFPTEAGGVALVTRLERINEDGSPVSERERWLVRQQDARGLNLDRFLQGSFFLDAGRYRAFVFILRDLPVPQPPGAWRASGRNKLPPIIALRTFSGGHCTVLVYEFSSDGTAVKLLSTSLTGKEHLEKAGLLATLEEYP